MANSAKKANECNQVTRFLQSRGVQYRDLEASERPDFWLTLIGGRRVAIELTEYRPREPMHGRSTRSDVEARWYRGLWQCIDGLRRQKPSLKHSCARLRFHDPELPGKRTHAQIAESVVELVETVAAQRTIDATDFQIAFQAAEAIANWRAPICEMFPGRKCYYLAARATLGAPGAQLFLVREEWPELSPILASIDVLRTPYAAWPPWNCPDIQGAWSDPSGREFRAILRDKQEKARKYRLSGTSLWLLIVCDVPDDVSSHIFPENGDDLTRLHDAIADSAFVFEASPFAEVWLFSQFCSSTLPIFQRVPTQGAGPPGEANERTCR
jgi:hypothetical protein